MWHIYDVRGIVLHISRLGKFNAGLRAVFGE